jgi:hypothetical protein
MQRKSTLLGILCFTVLVSIASAGYAQHWKLMTTFRTPIGCCFLFDSNNAIIGSGVRPVGNGATISAGAQVAIYKTTDGGVTWKGAFTPAMRGAVTQIFMQTPLIGYASIFSDGYYAKQELWRTTDGGMTWLGDLPVSGEGTCVYATSKALIYTDWDNSLYFGTHRYGGGYSPDGGYNWTTNFRERGNGIDFTDDLTGVLTQMNPTPGSFWRTTDGGLSWIATAAQLEAWSVYGVKGTKTFFTANESQTDQVHTTINWSTDGGANWQVRYDFLSEYSDMYLTGGIAGKGSTIYVQSDENLVAYGMFRSDDLGLSWKAIGGPSHNRDTRFAVTGCGGQVVYAFDLGGNVWKTTDGGDGGLSEGNPNEADFSVFPDTLKITTSNCIDSASFSMVSGSCARFTIDSVVAVGSGLKATNFALPIKLLQGQTATAGVVFTSPDSGNFSGSLTIFAHAGGRTFSRMLPTQVRSNTQESIALQPDTLHFTYANCTASFDSISLSAVGCNPLVIDSAIPADTGCHLLTTLPITTLGGPVRLDLQFASQIGGVRNSRLHIKAHAGTHKFDTLIIMVERVVLSPATLTLDHDSLQFLATACASLTESVKLTNTACDDLLIDSVTLAGKNYAITHRLTTSIFSSGSSDSLSITFSPITAGIASGTLTLHARRGTRAFDTTISLASITKATAERLGFQPDSLKLLTSACLSYSDTLRLFNVSCEQMTIDTIDIVPSQASGSEFSFLGLTSGFISAVDSIRVPILFTPDSGGVRTVLVHIKAHTPSATFDTTLTLSGTNIIPPYALSLSNDSVSIITKYCQPLDIPLALLNQSCNAMQIDSVRILGDLLGEFSLPDTAGLSNVAPQTRVSFQIEFRPSLGGTRKANLRIYSHVGGKFIDTTLQLSGTNVTSPEPYLGSIPSGFAGDTVRIPIFLRQTTDPFSIQKYSYHLSYNTDLLTCVGLQLLQTLSQPAISMSWQPVPGGLSVQVEMPNAITADSNLTLPLIYALMRVALTRDTLTTVRMDTFSADQKAREPLCNEPTQDFVLNYKCGDRTIVSYIRNGNANAAILSIQPNPVKSADRWQFSYKLESPTSLLVVEGYDANGKLIFSNALSPEKIGNSTLALPTMTTSGAYQIVLRSDKGVEDVRNVVIER